MDYMGGGFGSKFPADRWQIESAHLSKASGGKPVKMFLDRATELTIAGVRPSHFAKIKIGAKKDGTHHRLAVGILVERRLRRRRHGAPALRLHQDPELPPESLGRVAEHRSDSRLARAEPSAGVLPHLLRARRSRSQIEDGPGRVLHKNLDFTPRPDVYRRQLAKAAEMIEWKKNWHPRGEGKGPIRRGLGIGINSWGGAGHASKAEREDPSRRIGRYRDRHPGSRRVGTRTILAMVLAETMGLPMSQVKVKLGDNRYPVSGPSGGSTTVGGVCSSARKASVNALTKLMEAIAPSLNVPPDQLGSDRRPHPRHRQSRQGHELAAGLPEARRQYHRRDGRERSQEAGRLEYRRRGGIQMADVSVDIETGRVKLNRARRRAGLRTRRQSEDWPKARSSARAS